MKRVQRRGSKIMIPTKILRSHDFNSFLRLLRKREAMECANQFYASLLEDGTIDGTIIDHLLELQLQVIPDENVMEEEEIIMLSPHQRQVMIKNSALAFKYMNEVAAIASREGIKAATDYVARKVLYFDALMISSKLVDFLFLLNKDPKVAKESLKSSVFGTEGVESLDYMNDLYDRLVVSNSTLKAAVHYAKVKKVLAGSKSQNNSKEQGKDDDDDVIEDEQGRDVADGKAEDDAKAHTDVIEQESQEDERQEDIIEEERHGLLGWLGSLFDKIKDYF